MQGIYRISCLQDPRSYIGSSIDIGRRWGEHKKHLKAGTHKNYYLQTDWDAYGDESFIFEIVEETTELVTREQYWLDKYLTCKYNISDKAWNPMSNPEVVKKQQNSLNISGKRGNQKLKELDIKNIVDLAKTGIAAKQIANTYNISVGHVYNILNGNKWQDITGLIASPVSKRVKIKDAEIEIIKKEIELGTSYSAIGRLLGADYTTIRTWARKLNLRKPK